MKTSRRRFIALVGGSTSVALGPGAAFGQAAFPERFITLVVPLSPGGGADQTLLFFKDRVSSVLGQPLVTTYKPGAAGAVGTNFVVKAKPDGYTLLVANKGGLISTPLTMKDAGYTMADLVPVCLLTRSPSIFYVRDASPYKSLKDFVEAARKKPLNYATYGALSLSHLAMLLVQKTARVEATHIPYAGAAQANLALLGGHVEMAVGVSSASLVGPGKLRAVALTSDKRWDLYPNVPTLKELGYPVAKGDPFGAMFSIWAPKGTPKEVVDGIYRAFKKVADDNSAEIVKGLQRVELNLDFVGPGELGEVANEESALLKKVLDDLGVKPQ
jgi:tripartite-type tricarboxylate transporter receptor subunit TctC